MTPHATPRVLRHPVFGAAFCACLCASALGAEFDCVIEPRQVLELRSPIEGLIERINVDRGDLVKKGQELAVLDSAVDRAQAAIAKQRSQMDGAVRSGESRVEFTTNKSRRMEDLHRQNYLSAQGRDEAATEKRLAEAELRDSLDSRKLAELDLARQLEIIRLKTIRSPIDGVVVERLLHPGELAEAGVGRKPMLKIAQIDLLHVEVVLRAEAYGKVKTGSSIEVMPDIPPGSRHRATVKVVDRVLDAASGTFGVRLELPNPQRKIPAGIRCRASFPEIEAVPVGKARLPPARP
jgi:RND family efflux transporter MFP subunit